MFLGVGKIVWDAIDNIPSELTIAAACGPMNAHAAEMLELVFL